MCPQIKTRLLRKDQTGVAREVNFCVASRISASDTTLQLRLGGRGARASDANGLKGLAGKLASTSRTKYELSTDTKTDRGFNHDDLGRMLIPMQYYEAYENDPAG